MNKSVKIYLIFLVVVLLAIVGLDSTAPKPINWTPTYSINDKIPFGLYVFNKELHALLQPDTLTTINVTPYEYFDGLYDFDTLVNNYSTTGTFLAVNDFDKFDEESVKELLYFSSHGNTVFLSMKTMPKMLMDSLNLSFNSNFEHSTPSSKV